MKSIEVIRDHILGLLDEKDIDCVGNLENKIGILFKTKDAALTALAEVASCAHAWELTNFTVEFKITEKDEKEDYRILLTSI